MIDMLSYVGIIRLYTSPFVRAFRIVCLFLLLGFIYYQTVSYVFPKLAIFILLLFGMSEIFFHFKIMQVMPKQESSQDTADFWTCSTREALLAMTSASTKDMLSFLFTKKSVMSSLARMGINMQEVPFLEVEKNILGQEALTLSRKTQGKYVTTIDVFVAYLTLLEQKTKLMFQKELKEKDVLAIVSWVRKDMPEEETRRSMRVIFFGQGVFDDLVSGWTPLTKLYTTDWTYEHLSKRTYIQGVEKEYEEVVAALSKKENKNVLLVGDSGIGKENLLLRISQDSFSGFLSDSLSHKRILQLMTGALLAGAKEQADLEERLNSIIAEVSHAGNVLLFIPELQHILGSSDFNMNLSGALLPYLKNGSLPIIATVTNGNYKTYVEKNPLREAFGVVMLESPTKEVALQMLFEKAQEIEMQYQCIVSYKALQACISYASVFLPDDVLPGSAVSLLSAGANMVSLQKGKQRIVTELAIQQVVENKAKMPIGVPKKEEKALLLHFEEKLHERVIGQEEAISLISEAMRRVRGGLATAGKPISFLFLGPTGVGKTETAKSLATVYYRGTEHIIRLDMSEFADEEGRKRLLGSATGGSTGEGELTEKVHDHPYSLVLLDEFEKANPAILDLFLQVLDEGRLTDNKGKTVSFANTIIIATSNAGSEFIREEGEKGTVLDKSFARKLLNYLQEQRIFRPELLNRFDEVVTFLPLSKEEIGRVVKLLLSDVALSLKEQDIAFIVDESVVQKIVADGYDPEFGARPIRRYIQDKIEDLLAKMKLEDKIKRGSTVRISVDESQQIYVALS